MRTLFAGIVTAVALAASMSSSASAAAIVDLYVTPVAGQGNLSSTQALAANWYASNDLNVVATETFESGTYVAGSYSTAYDTAVGTFTAGDRGQYGGGLRILDKATRPATFDGRFNVTTGGSKWLDSNDYKTVVWDVAAGGQPFTHVGFYMTDVNDVNASLRIKGTGEIVNLDIDLPGENGSLQNGRVFFVGFGVDSAYDLLSLTFVQASGTDGWGIDDITIAHVPEPATLALLGAGLAGAGLLRRRRRTA